MIRVHLLTRAVLPGALVVLGLLFVHGAVQAQTQVQPRDTRTADGIAQYRALLADGRMLYAQKEVKVTLGGCGG